MTFSSSAGLGYEATVESYYKHYSKWFWSYAMFHLLWVVEVMESQCPFPLHFMAEMVCAMDGL